MRQARITKTEKEFCPADVQEHLRSENIRDYLSLLYDKAYSELGLQQSKRDQLITLYAGIFFHLWYRWWLQKKMPAFCSRPPG